MDINNKSFKYRKQCKATKKGWIYRQEGNVCYPNAWFRSTNYSKLNSTLVSVEVVSNTDWKAHFFYSNGHVHTRRLLRHEIEIYQGQNRKSA